MLRGVIREPGCGIDTDKPKRLGVMMSVETGIGRKELLRILRELGRKNHPDREAAHAGADAALLAYIDDDEITKAYEKGDFCW